MITHVYLKSGPSGGQAPLVVETPPSVTIFVGPNNSGKSVALREIFRCCEVGRLTPDGLVVDRLTFAGDDPADIQTELEAIKVAPNAGEPVPAGQSLVQVGASRFPILESIYIQARTSPNQNPVQFASTHLKHFTLNLDGPGRIALVNPQARGDLRRPSTPFARLLVNDRSRAALRQVIFESLGMYLAIDAQVGDRLQIRFGPTPSPDERSFNDDAIEYMRSARGIDAVSDGVKAFTGILIQLHAGDPRVIIVDEPEAFLHPSLAFRLGKEIANGSVTEGKRVFAATHSSQFVMGAILSGAKVAIIRLTYDRGVATARALSSDDLTMLMRDPLLRSARVLEALFYSYVIVCEADADRAFYQEINERLLASNDPRGIPNTLFLNANGKQTIPRIIEPLRKLGIPSAGIVDIDIVKDRGEEWTRHLAACGIPNSEYQPYGVRRASALDSLRSANCNFKTSGGVTLLSGSEREAADNLFDDLARYGLFVLREGEVEVWLAGLAVPRAKHLWLRSIFERMGSDPNSRDYVRPGPGDVWDFMRGIRAWLDEPRRRGISG